MKRAFRLLLSFLPLSILAALSLSCGSSDADREDEIKVPVEVATVRLGNLPQTIRYHGDIEAEFEVKVFSKVYDRIEKFFVDEGDYVAQGAPIAKVICTTIEQNARQAEAGLAAAKAHEANLRAEYERFQILYRDTSVSKQQYDAIATRYEAATAQLQQAEAALTSAKSLMHEATITAPIAGIIGKRYYEAGDMANPSLPVVDVVQIDRVKMKLEATDKDLGKLALQQRVSATVSAFSDRPFEGKITKIGPVLDAITRMAEVEVILDNPGHKLRPGMYAQAEVTTGILENVVTVPRYAVIENTSMERRAGKDEVIKNYFVFVIDSSKARQRKLELVYLNHESLAVSSGVQVGEKLVILGQNNLRDGTPVVITKEEDGAS